MKRILVVLLAVVVGLIAVWYVRQRSEGPVPVKEAGEIVRGREVTLYFGSADGSSVVPEHREIPSSDEVLKNLRTVIEALISGPEDDGIATVPSSVRLLAAYVHDKTAYLDFSREIIDDFSGGTAAEYMLVASIVQTTCANFAEINAVRILVEGHETDTLGGHLRISKVLRPQDWR